MKLIALLLTTIIVTSTQAGQPCTDQLPQAATVQKAFRLALNTRQQLDASGAKVALIARVGHDLSKYGLRYSHLALAWRDHPEGRWVVVHELNQCGTANSALFNEGLANVFLDDMHAFEALVVIPATSVQEKISTLLARPGSAMSLHQPRYNMLAYPFSTQYQNSNQWLLEFMAEPLADTPLPYGNRSAAQEWLRQAGYQPTTLSIPASTRLGARMFRANVAFDDHPPERRWDGKIDTVTVESVVAFLKRRDPNLIQYVVTLTDSRQLQSPSKLVLKTTAAPAPVSTQLSDPFQIAKTSMPLAPVKPVNAQLLEHLYQQLDKRENQTPSQPGLTYSPAAVSEADYQAAKDQLLQLGQQASPLALRIAKLSLITVRNQLDFSWLLINLTPEQPTDSVSVAKAITKFNSSSGAARLVSLATLGRTRSPEVIAELQTTVSSDGLSARLLAVMGLAFSGTAAPHNAGVLLAKALTDKDANVRFAAVNSIRLLGSGAQVAVPALIDYLKSRDQVALTSSALNSMPLDSIRPYKTEFETILKDHRLSIIQKKALTDLLFRIETAKQ